MSDPLVTTAAAPGSMTARVRAAVDRMRPALQLDGGDLELVSVDEASGVVTVALSGACVGCSNQSTTVAFGVERAMKQMVPGVTAVEVAPEGVHAGHAH